MRFAAAKLIGADNRSRRGAWLCALALCGVMLSVQAQDVTLYALQGQLQRGSQNVTTLGTDLLGDQVNLYNGALEFNHTDVSLPGNNELPVTIGRRHVAGRVRTIQGEFGDWDLDVPYVHGTFSTDRGWVNAANTTARCSNYGPPPTFTLTGTAWWYAEEYWQGNFVSIPGSGRQEILRRGSANTQAPTDGQTYPLVTRGHWQIRCLPSVTNGAGEGFVALSPQGTQYRFDWMAMRAHPLLRDGSGSAMSRREVRLMATLVTDRHGNTVSYTYDAANPGRLTRIHSSDGRIITLTYTTVGGKSRVQTVNDGSRTWTYAYSVQGDLASVTLPDGSSWQFSLRSLVYPYPEQLGDSAGCDFIGGWPADTLSGTITHPSGAVGTFSTRYLAHGRVATARHCVQKKSQGPIYARWPKAFMSQTLVSKRITGPGIDAMQWTYSYPNSLGSWTPCTAGCAKPVTVTDPRGVVTRYLFGRTFQVDEGQLLQQDDAWDGSTALRSTVNRYRQPSGQAYPEPAGISPSEVGDQLAARHRPLDKRTITQQGVTFTWEAAAGSAGFDNRARPVVATRSSSLGFTKTDTTAYHDNTAKWMLGQVGSVTDSSGIVQERHTYDNVTANKTASYAFARLSDGYAYHPSGMLHWHYDSAGRGTRYSNHMRGIAQNITYPDSTAESAVVSNIGRINSATNAAGTTTAYGYDAMGRLVNTTHPNEAGLTYHPTTQSFQLVNSPEYGIAAGHWRQTIGTGNAVTIRYFDAMWRERLKLTYDAANAAGTSSFVETRYDADGRKTFVSYPSRTFGTVDSAVAGTAWTYDGLGRQSSQVQSSELGALTTSTAYLPSFQKRVTNARGFATTFAFQAFDVPSEDAITAVWAPEGSTLGIVRDVFGKPLSITRSGGGLAATRAYVYDGFARLCKSIEPESGANVQAYDAANNVAWRASGLSLPSTSSCDYGSVPASRQITYGYDTRNRLSSTSYGDGSAGIGRNYTADGLLNQIWSAGSTWSYGYNNRRLRTVESLAFNGGTYGLSWGLDAHGNVASLTYPDGGVLSYWPDAFGRPTQASGFASGVWYHPNGLIGGYTLANGIAHSSTQSTRGLPAQWRDAGVVQDAYGYDANANVTAITDQQEGISSRSMGYDGLDRLTAANGIWGAGSFGYDALDNLRLSTVGGRSAVATIDGANRLSSLNVNGVVQGFGYDANGNLTARGAQGFDFDIGNRLRAAYGRASYAYDGHGRRTWLAYDDGSRKLQVCSEAGKLLWTGHSAQGNTKHIYLGDRLIAEANNLSGVSYSHTDALGSPVARTNVAAQITSRTRYEPYGATAAGTNPTGIGFTGHVNDADTGLVYMQQRYYEPLAGRFLSVDPVTTSGKDGGSFNRYAYAENNPYKFKDPDGQAVETPWDAANVALGVVSLTKNLATGNYGGAVVDALGVAYDMAATATPLLPGGAATAINAGRASSKIADVAKAAETSIAAKGADFAVRFHHPYPQYLGGKFQQLLEPLPKELHDVYHSGLDKVLPRQIKGGATEFYGSLSAAEKAVNLQKFEAYTKAFDKKYGTALWGGAVREGVADQ
jgi:RHS repeat-associated protein